MVLSVFFFFSFIHSVIRSVCLSFRLPSVCLPFLQLSRCHRGTATGPSHGRIRCRGDKRKADERLTHNPKMAKSPSPENLRMNHVTGATRMTPLRCTHMNVKVSVVGFATRPTRCGNQGSKILSRSPNKDTVASESFLSACLSVTFRE